MSTTLLSTRESQTEHADAGSATSDRRHVKTAIDQAEHLGAKLAALARGLDDSGGRQFNSASQGYLVLPLIDGVLGRVELKAHDHIVTTICLDVSEVACAGARTSR